MDIFIEISKGTSIKYEYKDNKLKVDRFLNVPFAYPFNYGYIPNTICDEEEEFCEKYDYEPDEQSLEVQNRSLIEIKRLSEIDILEKKVGKMKL